jgi:hypothetical protein
MAQDGETIQEYYDRVKLTLERRNLLDTIHEEEESKVIKICPTLKRNPEGKRY